MIPFNNVWSSKSLYFERQETSLALLMSNVPQTHALRGRENGLRSLDVNIDICNIICNIMLKLSFEPFSNSHITKRNQ